jgi:hypothetical protein
VRVLSLKMMFLETFVFSRIASTKVSLFFFFIKIKCARILKRRRLKKNLRGQARKSTHLRCVQHKRVLFLNIPRKGLLAFLFSMTHTAAHAISSYKLTKAYLQVGCA